MDTFYADNKNKLERFEWDDMWWDNSTPDRKYHILVIGDSISRSYRHALKSASENTLSIDNFATSKAVDNESFPRALDLVISQQDEYDLVLFNNGLHGWHLSSDNYGEHYLKMLENLKPKCKRLAVILTTPWLDTRNSLVIERNGHALKHAKALGLDIIDAYSLLDGREELFSGDKIHLNSDGVKLLAEFIRAKINEILK